RRAEPGSLSASVRYPKVEGQVAQRPPASARKAGMTNPIGRSTRRSGTERKPRKERWAELIEVATQVFYEKGYEAASLQDIADRVGVLKGSLYYYIQSKEELLFEVVDALHRQDVTVVSAQAQGPATPLERLDNVIRGHVEHTCRNLVPTAVFLHALAALTPERQQQVLGNHSYQGVFRALIEEAKASGEVHEDVDPRLAALSILGSTNWVYRWFRPGGESSITMIATRSEERRVGKDGTSRRSRGQWTTARGAGPPQATW